MFMKSITKIVLLFLVSFIVVGTIDAKKVKYPNGDYYVGDWKKGQPHGEGTMTYINGNKYVGQWNAGKKDGQGLMYYSDGSIYQGNWVADIQHGKGRMNYVDGSSYDGNWKAGKRDGSGQILYKDGIMYEGGWSEDAKEGEGRINFPDGKYISGIWRNGSVWNATVDAYLYYNGEYHKDCLFNGTIKEGICYEGKIKGYYKNTFYDGQFKEGKTYSGISRIKNEPYTIETHYKDGVEMVGEIKTINWVYKGGIKNGKPFKEGVITTYNNLMNKNQSIKLNITDSENKVVLVLNHNIEVVGTIPTLELNDDFNRWVNETFRDMPKKLDAIKLEQIETKQKENQLKKEQEKQVYWENAINELPNYIWNPSVIRDMKKQNPARVNKLFGIFDYVILKGTVLNIKTSKETDMIFSYVEHTLYTIQLAEGAFLESYNTDIVSELYKGKQAYFIGTYSDENPYRTTFKIIGYEDSLNSLIQELKDGDIKLDKFVKVQP